MKSKIDYQKFNHLLSAMVFFSDKVDKFKMIKNLFPKYRESTQIDPVIWGREWFAGNQAGSHTMYIRETFKATKYSQVK